MCESYTVRQGMVFFILEYMNSDENFHLSGTISKKHFHFSTSFLGAKFEPSNEKIKIWKLS